MAGFLSDAYCAEWCYGKLRLTQRMLAEVLAEKVKEGFFNLDDAVSITRTIMFETPMALYHLVDESS